MNGEVELHVGDLHAGLADYGAQDNTYGLSMKEIEMWLHNDQEEFIAMNDDASLFNADFPPLPDFSCMVPPSSSSLSFSSSTPAPTKTTTCSPSSDSWAALKSDLEEDAEKLIKQQNDPVFTSMEISQPTDPLPLGDFMEHDFFDPAFFQNDEIEIENPLEEFIQEEQQQQQQQQHAEIEQHQPQEEAEDKNKIQEEGVLDDELRSVFLEWLKTNKDRISADDLRSVKLREATIEDAAKRLGGGKESMKKLLKPVLAWVQKNHLQNKRRKKNNTPLNALTQYQDPTQNTNTNPASNLNYPCSFGPAPNPWFNHSPWIPQPTFGAHPSVFYPPVVGYVGDPYREGSSNNINGAHNAANMLQSAYSWPHSHFTGASHYNHGPGGDRLKRSDSVATKEARKKRMAKYLSLHRHHNQHCQRQNQQHLSQTDADSRGSGNCTAVATGHTSQSKGASVVPAMAAEPVSGRLKMDRKAIQTKNHHQGDASSDWQQKNQHGNDGATPAGTSANK